MKAKRERDSQRCFLIWRKQDRQQRGYFVLQDLKTGERIAVTSFAALEQQLKQVLKSGLH